MRRNRLRTTLLAATSSLALTVAMGETAEAATCIVVTNPATPYSQSGNTCVTFNAVNRTGSVTNTGTVTASGAPLSVSRTGISVVGGATIIGSVTNSGRITPTSGNGIFVEGASVSGALINASGGTITGTNGSTGGGSGISVNSGTVGSITNNGTITENNYPDVGFEITSNATVNGDVVNNGTMSAPATGVIQFVNSGTITGNIINSGTLTNTYSNTQGVNLGAGVYIYSAQGPISLGGSIINTTGGTITGGFGIQVFATSATHLVTIGSGGSGGITNAGTITVGRTGVEVGSVTLTGGISNSGTISAGLNGIQLINLTTATAPGGTPTNLGTAGPPSVAGGITNSGTITASGGAGYAGIMLVGANVANGITNSAGGTISAAGGTGILIGNTGKITYPGSGINGVPGPGTTYTVTAVGGSTLTGGINNQGTITAKTGIAVDGGSTVVGGITNGGTINGSTDAINLAGEGGPTTITITGGVVTGNIVGGGADTLDFAPTGTFPYNSNFSAVSAVNVNSGTVVLNGTADSATTLTVSNGGTLAGTGTIATAMTIMNGGVFAPGTIGTPGTAMHVTGGVAFDPTATYRVYLNPTTASLANISGMATLDNATVNAVFSPGSYVSKQYTILTSGGLVGTFNATITNTNLPIGASDTLSYSGDDVFLNLTSSYSGGGLSGNQQSVANALISYFNAHGGIPAQFFNLTPAQLTQVDGEDSTGASTGTFQIVNDFFNLLSDIALGNGGGGGGGGGNAPGFAAEDNSSLPPDVALAYARALHKPQPQAASQQAFDQRWTAWGSGFGGAATYDGNATVGSNTLSASDYGFAGGMDYHTSADLKVGFALAGAGANWSLAQNLGSGRSDSFQAAGYAIKHFGPLYLTGIAGIGNSWFTTNRTAALGDQLQAKFDGQTYALRGEAGYRYAVLPMAGVTPYAAVQTQWLQLPGYSETDLSGGGFALSYGAQTANDTRSELGARADDLTTFNGMPLVLRGRLAWAHDWLTNPAVSAAFQALPGTAFTVNGAAVPKNSALTTAAAQLYLTANWSFEAKFDGQFASSAQTYAGTGTLKYSW